MTRILCHHLTFNLLAIQEVIKVHLLLNHHQHILLGNLALTLSFSDLSTLGALRKNTDRLRVYRSGKSILGSLNLTIVLLIQLLLKLGRMILFWNYVGSHDLIMYDLLGLLVCCLELLQTVQIGPRLHILDLCLTLKLCVG